MTETELAERLHRMGDEANDSDWFDVGRRAKALSSERPDRRRRAVFAVAIAAAVAVPALGLAAATDLIPGFRGEPGPPEVQATFARLAASDLPDGAIARGVKAHEAKGVMAVRSPAGTVRVWIAPTETGETCRLLQIGDDPIAQQAFNCKPRLKVKPAQVGVTQLITPAGFTLVDGQVGPGTTSMVVQMADGSRRTLPIVDGYFAAVFDESERPKAIVIVRGDTESTFTIPPM